MKFCFWILRVHAYRTSGGSTPFNGLANTIPTTYIYLIYYNLWCWCMAMAFLHSWGFSRILTRQTISSTSHKIIICVWNLSTNVINHISSFPICVTAVVSSLGHWLSLYSLSLSLHHLRCILFFYSWDPTQALAGTGWRCGFVQPLHLMGW